MSKPLLTIGMIFRNDIRCIERCLKSLQFLRDAVSCELVMADTGSTDGSRRIAEQYADIVFDFSWINDFAAARNAVMDRASGVWYLSIDSDEWLEGDMGELISCIQGKMGEPQACFVLQRNYTKRNLAEGYMDTQVLRLARMDTGLRFHGSIHESWRPTGNETKLLGETILHHDGYAFSSQQEMEGKYRRNLDLLVPMLEKNPDDCRRMLQCLESAYLIPEENMTYAKLSIKLMQRLAKRRPSPQDWLIYGPAIYRQAVWTAHHVKQDTLAEQWLALGEAAFPDSPYIQIDFAYFKALRAFQKGEYEKVPDLGADYARGLEKYQAGGYPLYQTVPSTLYAISPMCQEQMILLRAEALYHLARLDEMKEVLERFQPEDCIPDNLRIYIELLVSAYRRGQEVSHMVRRLAPLLAPPKPGDEQANRQRNVLFPELARIFYSADEIPAYPMLAAIDGDLGLAAAILAEDDAVVLEEMLSGVENWAEFPTPALAHALKQGVCFPLPEKPFNLEEMDGLATRLSEDKKAIFTLACEAGTADFAEDWHKLTWARGLTMAAVRVFDWQAEDVDEKQGMALVRAFARTEKEFLIFCYAPQMLCRKNLFALPPMHRFGWYCAQAFDVLNAGDSAGYVRLLREGLSVCEGMKDMVKFIIDHTPELQAPEPSDELRALAEQIRAVLENFSPDDPAVAALKASEAYQKVAYLIEGIEPPIVGGLPQ